MTSMPSAVPVSLLLERQVAVAVGLLVQRRRAGHFVRGIIDTQRLSPTDHSHTVPTPTEPQNTTRTVQMEGPHHVHTWARVTSQDGPSLDRYVGGSARSGALCQWVLQNNAAWVGPFGCC
jgi:hypothetical protein